MTEPLDMTAVRRRFTKIVNCNRITSCREAFLNLSHNYVDRARSSPFHILLVKLV